VKFEITSPDPLNVLSSTKPVVESLEYVEIHEENLDNICGILLDRLKKGTVLEEMNFGDMGNLKDNVQLIFLEDVVNFCFWAEKGKAKWEVESPKGNKTDGWYALTNCFARALAQGKPILKADYLENITLEEAKSLFESSNGTDIPLLKERVINLREAGKVLRKKYAGEFVNVLEKADYDSIKLTKLLVKNFPSFRDIAKWEKKEIYFLKRAQICGQDLSYIKGLRIKNVDVLSSFADYKVPQMLRKFGIISYKPEFASEIDNYILVQRSSRKEIEIRSSAIWCIELIKQKLKKYTRADIDNALWLISQDKSNVKPYHRTYSIYY
jgi:hypothetical protein